MFDGDKKTKYYSAKIQFPAAFAITLNDGEGGYGLYPYFRE